MKLSTNDVAKLKRRILSKIKVMLPDAIRCPNCWLWQGATAWTRSQPDKPYGVIVWEGQVCNVRRLAYQYLGVGLPKAGARTVDCLCGNSLCINPDHLIRGKQRKSPGPAGRRKA